MLSFPSSLKIFLALDPCDMRKGFNGLHALVSERLNPAQMELILGAESTIAPLAQEPLAPATPAQPSRPHRREHAPRLPENLPVVEEIVDPEPVEANPQDWRQIGQEVSEQLDYEPGRFLRRRLVRRAYVHRKNLDLDPLTAPLPGKLQDRCIAAPGLLAQVIVSKFCDHTPLYRQEQILKTRHKVHLPRQTLDRWVDLAAQWFRPIYNEIRKGVVSGGYVQLDETPIRYLEPGFGRARQGYYWVCKKPGGDVVFHWEPSRSSNCLDKIIPVDFRGVIQCDGYGAYPAFVERRDNRIKLAACWAHVRRKFHKALGRERAHQRLDPAPDTTPLPNRSPTAPDPRRSQPATSRASAPKPPDSRTHRQSPCANQGNAPTFAPKPAGRYPSGERALSGYPVNVVECMGAQENATGQTGTITWSA
jgi:transposase